jgi:hypothetical protein
MLFLSSVAAGLIATFVMIFFLYLPLLWRGNYFDVLGALGSFLTKEVDGRSRLIGAIFYVLVGILFALFYGWIALLPTLDDFPECPDGDKFTFPRFWVFHRFGSRRGCLAPPDGDYPRVPPARAVPHPLHSGDFPAHQPCCFRNYGDVFSESVFAALSGIASTKLNE